MTRVRVQYFAVLRDQAGRSDEVVESAAATAGALYGELARRRGLSLPAERLKVAIDGEFAPWETPLREDMQLVFIPPFAGG